MMNQNNPNTASTPDNPNSGSVPDNGNNNQNNDNIPNNPNTSDSALNNDNNPNSDSNSNNNQKNHNNKDAKQEMKRSCIDCAVINCDKQDKMYPDFCPTIKLDEEFIGETRKQYTEDEENAQVTLAAAEVEFENYCTMTRIEEIMEFAQKINARKLGIATCVGLISEARTAAKIFRHHGFEVFGAACKVGAQPKTAVGIDARCEAVGKNMCNPIMQAKLLNEENTDLNIVMGLCVGHDSLFYKYSEALCTTLVTKDRVLAHNPAAALYQANAYYSKLLK